MAEDAGHFGKYRILGELGRGEAATVYHALDTTLDREVAQALIGWIIIALVLLRAAPTLPSKTIYLLPSGWAMGFALGSVISTAIGGPYEPIPRTLIFVAIDAAISGAIGGGVMFWRSTGRGVPTRLANNRSLTMW